MNSYELNGTIAAIATGVGESGIGIVRLSGKDALSVADRVFVSKDGQRPSTFKSHTIHYGWIVQQISGSTEIIDEVLLTIMRAPRSYTKEDIVEINCHGGIVALKKVLDLVLAQGCRLAQPGEFTRRAFLNGRIDLTEAEAVLDVIRAKTEAALKISVEQLRGILSKRIDGIREALLEIVSAQEAEIDFPEDQIIPLEREALWQKLENTRQQIKSILRDAGQGKVLREGIKTVICGKPNVGKSSLLNALLKEERSIVTAVAGTTRDAIEEIIDIRGIPVRIVDTAGIIEPRDLIEKKAVQRARQYIRSADLVIVLFDAADKLAKEDEFIIRQLKRKAVIAVINKIDLREKIQKDKILRQFKYVVGISAKKNKNINLLEEAIVSLVYAGRIPSAEAAIISNLRHIQALREVEKLIARAINSLDNKLSLEFVAQDLKDALGYLDQLLGRRFSEDLLDKIFSEFCIGK